MCQSYVCRPGKTRNQLTENEGSPTYEKGVILCGIEKRDLEQRLERSEELNYWDITIQPKPVRL